MLRNGSRSGMAATQNMTPERAWKTSASSAIVHTATIT